MPDKTIDELLREFLNSKPQEATQRLFNELQAQEQRFVAWQDAHEKSDNERHAMVLAAIGGHDVRIKQVEKSPYRGQSFAPPGLEKYRTESPSGSFKIPEHELEEAMKTVQARDALAQKNAVLSAIGKVLVAVASAAAIFLAGTGYRDCSARPAVAGSAAVK